jgi:hypothetical protein
MYKKGVLLIDSHRDLPHEVACRDFESALNAIYSEKQWDLVYLDFDLGTKDDEGICYTGRTLLVKMYEDPPEKMPARFKIITSNLAAKSDMETMLIEMGYARNDDTDTFILRRK